MKDGSFLLMLLAACAALPAQSSVVVPANHAAREGSNWADQPFGLGTQGRVQHLYGAGIVATPPTAVVRGLAWRGDGRADNVAKANVDFELLVSTSLRDPLAPATHFPANHGVQVVTVFQRKLVQLPGLPPAGSWPRPFSILFPFDVPYVYVNAAGTLVVEGRSYNQPGGAYPIDAVGWEQAREENRGFDCGQIFVRISGGTVPPNPSDLEWQVESAPAGGIALLLLGTTVLPAPLRLPVGPCFLYQDAPVILAGAVSAGGAARFSLPVTRGMFLAVLHSQVVAADPALTRMPSTATRITTIGGAYPVSTVFNIGSVTLPFGSAWTTVAPVVEVRL